MYDKYLLEEYSYEDCYIPSVESLFFINFVIKEIYSKSKNLIFDVGSGSGFLGTTLARSFPESSVIGFDCDEKTIVTANINKENRNITNIDFMISDYVRSAVACPDIIVADLPWGSIDYLLPSNAKRDLDTMPEISLFPKIGGPMGCYKDLIKQIICRNWKTKLFIETGIMPKSLIINEIELVVGSESCSVQYHLLENGCSAVEIDFFGNKILPSPSCHKHLLYTGFVSNERARFLDENPCLLTNLLYRLLEVCDMNCLVTPVIKRSDRNAWTGLMGIITSHMSFHFWTDEYGIDGKPTLQFDLYSCKDFNEQEVKDYLDNYFLVTTSSILVIDRSTI